MPSDEEREALRQVVYESIERWADLLPTPDVAGYVADAVANAGFHRQGQITEASRGED
jgi:hypothetical protein